MVHACSILVVALFYLSHAASVETKSCDDAQCTGAYDDSALVQKTLKVHSGNEVSEEFIAEAKLSTEEAAEVKVQDKDASAVRMTPPRLPAGQTLMGKHHPWYEEPERKEKIFQEIKAQLPELEHRLKILNEQTQCAHAKIMNGFGGLNGPVVNKLRPLQIDSWDGWQDVSYLMSHAVVQGMRDMLDAYEAGLGWDEVQSPAVDDAVQQCLVLDETFMLRNKLLWSSMVGDQSTPYEFARIFILNEQTQSDLLCDRVWNPIIETRVASYNLWNQTSQMVNQLHSVWPLSPNGTEDNTWNRLDPKERTRMLSLTSGSLMDPDKPIGARLEAMASTLETLSGYLEVGQMAAAVRGEVCTRPPTDFSPQEVGDFEHKCTNQMRALIRGEEESGAAGKSLGFGFAVAMVLALIGRY